MNFRDSLPIYLQIAERLMDEIVAGQYKADERVPGVRDYSTILQVNVNTTTKAFDQLRQRGIIYDRRGMGSYVSPEACEIILNQRREDFLNMQIPALARTMQQLGIEPEQLMQHLTQHLSHNTDQNTDSNP